MDIFEEYYSYIGNTSPKTKEEIIEDFKTWLDNPLTNNGFFCVRWVEDNDLLNVTTFKDFSEKVTRYL